MDYRLLKLNQILVGWINYFGIWKAGLGEDFEHVFANNGNDQELGVRILLNLEWINIRHINIQTQERAIGEFTITKSYQKYL